MKKILVLLSMFTLASGAWAAEVYDYTLIVHGFPHPTVKSTLSPDESETVKGLPSDTIMMLVDKDSGLQFLELTYQDLSPASYNYQTATYSGASKPVVANGEAIGFFNVSWSVGNDNVSESGYFLKISLTDVTFADGTYKAYMSKAHTDVDPLTGNTRSYLDSLVAVMSSESARSSQTAAISAGSTASLSSEIMFNPVPEPTSGLLLILGVAGLALKRKKAA